MSITPGPRGSYYLCKHPPHLTHHTPSLPYHTPGLPTTFEAVDLNLPLTMPPKRNSTSGAVSSSSGLNRLPTLAGVLMRKTRPPLDLFCFYVSWVKSSLVKCMNDDDEMLMRCTVQFNGDIRSHLVINRSSYNKRTRKTLWIFGWMFNSMRICVELISRWVRWVEEEKRRLIKDDVELCRGRV